MIVIIDKIMIDYDVIFTKMTSSKKIFDFWPSKSIFSSPKIRPPRRAPAPPDRPPPGKNNFRKPRLGVVRMSGGGGVHNQSYNFANSEHGTRLGIKSLVSSAGVVRTSTLQRYRSIKTGCAGRKNSYYERPLRATLKTRMPSAHWLLVYWPTLIGLNRASALSLAEWPCGNFCQNKFLSLHLTQFRNWR